MPFESLIFPCSRDFAMVACAVRVWHPEILQIADTRCAELSPNSPEVLIASMAVDSSVFGLRPGLDLGGSSQSKDTGSNQRLFGDGVFQNAGPEL